MEETRRISVALVDDQELVRRGLSLLLAEFPDLDLIHQCADGTTLIAAVSAQPVDVIVSDIRMPQMSGLEMLQQLRARDNQTAVVLLTTFNDAGLLAAAVKAGAQGYLLKDASATVLHEAICRAAGGGTMFQPVTPSLVRNSWPDAGVLPGTVSLSEREIDILRLIAGGYSNKEIARSLRLAEGTVKNYVSELLVKLESRDRTHAVLNAITRRLI